MRLLLILAAFLLFAGEAGGQQTHVIRATWFGPGSPALEHRIALFVRIEGREQSEWIVLKDKPYCVARSVEGPTFGQWSWELRLRDVPYKWADDDSGIVRNVLVYDLLRATHLRVDTRVWSDAPWTKSAPAPIPAYSGVWGGSGTGIAAAMRLEGEADVHNRYLDHRRTRGYVDGCP